MHRITNGVIPGLHRTQVEQAAAVMAGVERTRDSRGPPFAVLLRDGVCSALACCFGIGLGVSLYFLTGWQYAAVTAAAVGTAAVTARMDRAGERFVPGHSLNTEDSP